jgi:DNA-directed RNA polymerase specialized sigma24 family protein
MADFEPANAQTWLPVIGRSLAYLCLSKAIETDPDKYKDVLAKVKFLQGLGLPQGDAAEAAGSSVASVKELQRRKKATHGKAKTKRSR